MTNEGSPGCSRGDVLHGGCLSSHKPLSCHPGDAFLVVKKQLSAGEGTALCTLRVRAMPLTHPLFLLGLGLGWKEPGSLGLGEAQSCPSSQEVPGMSMLIRFTDQIFKSVV